MIDRQQTELSKVNAFQGTGMGGTNFAVIASLVTENLGEPGNYILSVSGFWYISDSARTACIQFKVGSTVYTISNTNSIMNSTSDKFPFHGTFMVPSVAGGTTISVRAGIAGNIPCGGPFPPCPSLTIERLKFSIEGVPVSQVIP